MPKRSTVEEYKKHKKEFIRFLKLCKKLIINAKNSSKDNALRKVKMNLEDQ